MMVQSFITALQFLTRLRIAAEISWSPEEFGRSVKFFPLVGAVIGVLWAAAYYAAKAYLSVHILTVGLVAVKIIITGGLHCDGFMDTMDGLFSGRSRERMLEIMKDSRVGANGVVAFVLLVLSEWSVLLDMPQQVMPYALLTAPILGRMAMVAAITSFPYARPEGMGKAFAQYADKRSLGFALATTAIIILPLGMTAAGGFVAALAFALLFSRYVTKVLGGLTGDVYGAVTELTELLVLLCFIF